MKIFRKYVLLCFYLTIEICLNGQNPYVIHWGDPQTSGKNFLTRQIIHADTNGVLILRQEMEEYYKVSSTIDEPSGKKFPPLIEHFTPDLNRDYSFELKNWSLKNEPGQIQFGKPEGNIDRWYFPFWTNGKPWLAYSNYQQEEAQTDYYAREIDVRNGKLIGNPVEIFRFKDTIESQVSNGRIRLRQVRDQANSKIMFITFPYYEALNKFKVRVFDQKMKGLWGKEYELPFESSTFEIRDFCLSVTGKFYCLARVYEKLPDRVLSMEDLTNGFPKDQATFSTILLEFSSDSESANMFRLEMGKNVLVDAKLREDKEGLIHCIGGYSPDHYSRMYGCVDFVLNPFDQTLTQSGPLPFSPSVLQKISLEKNTIKKPYLDAFEVSGVQFGQNRSINFWGTYGDARGAYHIIQFSIDSLFQSIDGIRIKKSQSVERQSDWIFAGSNAIPEEGEKGIVLFNDNIQGNNQINIFDFSLETGKSFLAQQPDSKSRILLVTKALYSTKERIYLVGETRNHKTYRIGYLERKP